MGRYILRYTGPGTPPDADLERVHSTPGVTVVDVASPRMLLVQALPETVRQLVAALPGWTSTREQTTPLPDPRPRIRSS